MWGLDGSHQLIEGEAASCRQPTSLPACFLPCASRTPSRTVPLAPFSRSRSLLTSPTARPVTRDRRTQFALARKDHTCALRTAGCLILVVLKRVGQGSQALRVRSLICQTARAQERQDGPCVDLDRQPHARITHALPIVHWIPWICSSTARSPYKTTLP